MGATPDIYSSLLNGLDIVAVTHTSGSQSYPAGAKYALVTDADAGALFFPMCFRVGISGRFQLHYLRAGTSPLEVGGFTVDTSTGKYDSGNASMSITWFG